jgi:hypothetical protein
MPACWGQAPSDAAPRGPGWKLGAAACAAGTRRNRGYRRPLRALRGRCQLCNARTRTSLAAEPWQHREALRASMSLIPLLLRGIRDGMTSGEDEPEPDGS